MPNNGFSDFFNLTLKQARWNVRIINKVYGDENTSKIDLKIEEVCEKSKVTTSFGPASCAYISFSICSLKQRSPPAKLIFSLIDFKN